MVEQKDPQQENIAQKALGQQPVEPKPLETQLKNNGKRAKWLWCLTGLFLIVALIWFALWFFYFQFYETTDDAYTNSNKITINSAISGSVVAFYADETDLVLEGQLIVQLDPTDYQAIYDKQLATLASVVLQVKQLYQKVKVERANVKNQKILVMRYRRDYKDRLKIVNTGAVAREDFMHSRDDYYSSIALLKAAKHQLQALLDLRGPTRIKDHSLIQEQKGNVLKSYYDLAHCSIYAPTTGYVAQRAVDVGQWATPTTPLMAIIPSNYVWVDANFKETQLRYMRIGQPATVTLDIYGSKVKYSGSVLGIASGTGSVFSIIPPQNATGNWIKIVQRLPVRISLDHETVKKFPTRLGLSAVVDVDISNRDLPMLAGISSTQAVAKTKVFDIDFDSINKIINKIISKNLR